MQIKSPDILQIARFSSLSTWSASHIVLAEMHSKYPLVPLFKILKRVKEPINIEDNTLYRRITVRNNGRGVVQRDELHGREIGTKRQFVAHAGQLIISRIDARNGAFGIVPKELEGAIVTNDFWLFEVHDALTEYLMLVLSSERFQQYWQSQSNGTTNRQRVEESNFSSSLIALPTLDEQHRIVDVYMEKMRKAIQMRLTALNLESHIDDEIFRSLGIAYRNVTGASLNGLRFIRYAGVDKWAVDYLLNRGCCDFVKTSRYPVVQAKYFIKECQYGLSYKASKDSSGVPILRMNNIKKTRVDISDMKYVPSNLKSIGKYFLHCGDLLLNRTNSKELVGKTAMFSLQGDYVFASYLIRIVLNQEIADARYINYIFASRIVRSQVDMISRQVLGQANINVEEVKSLQFPLPPIIEQKRIATAIDNIYSQVDRINQGADALETYAKREFNGEVFG